jgi:6-hydroxycyclohex-1-ene-1-carbonyl-CoA dehydrogenase
MRISSWVVQQPGRPMVEASREESAGPGEVLVRVAGCGVCHTDLGYFYDGVPTRHAFPLTLGHEVSGTVVEVGTGAENWMGLEVIIPAVIPCGHCEACRAGRGSICPKQVFPGNDLDGGFGTHLRVPAAGLCPVPNLSDAAKNAAKVDLETLSVIADAVSTPYQAILRSGLAPGDIAVFVGVGGVGGFGAQIAAAMGALVVAVDVSQERLDALEDFGVRLALRADQLDIKALRASLRDFAKQSNVPSFRHKIFETSGTVQGQAAAFSLLGPGGYLSIVGFTPKPVEVRLSNLMAFDATAQGNWGCLPEHYPPIVDLVLAGKVALTPFVERRPMASINQTFADIHDHKVSGRVVLIPEH